MDLVARRSVYGPTDGYSARAHPLPLALPTRIQLRASLARSLAQIRVYTPTRSPSSHGQPVPARGTNTNGVARSTGGPNRRPLISSRGNPQPVTVFTHM